MRVSTLVKRYPEQFEAIQLGVQEEINRAVGKDKQYLKYCDNPKMREKLKVVAFNAAAIAVLEFHKIASRKNAKETGKTSNNK